MKFSRQEYWSCHFLFQGIFLTQRLNPDILYCKQILYHLSHQRTSSLKSIIKDLLKVRLEKITFPIIFPNKTQGADWLCLLRTYCRCPQSSPVPKISAAGRMLSWDPTTSIRDFAMISDDIFLNSNYSGGITPRKIPSNILTTTGTSLVNTVTSTPILVSTLAQVKHT